MPGLEFERSTALRRCSCSIPNPPKRVEHYLASGDLKRDVVVRCRCGDRHGFGQVLELLHAAQFSDDFQHFDHTLESAKSLNCLGNLLDLFQRDRATVCCRILPYWKLT